MQQGNHARCVIEYTRPSSAGRRASCRVLRLGVGLVLRALHRHGIRRALSRHTGSSPPRAPPPPPPPPRPRRACAACRVCVVSATVGEVRLCEGFALSGRDSLFPSTGAGSGLDVNLFRRPGMVLRFRGPAVVSGRYEKV